MGIFDDISGDVRWAVRGLRKRPTFTAVAVATLAPGIGANSAILTLVNAHFLTPLPYQAPENLVLLWETGRDNMEVRTVAPGNYWQRWSGGDGNQHKRRPYGRGRHDVALYRKGEYALAKDQTL